MRAGRRQARKNRAWGQMHKAVALFIAVGATAVLAGVVLILYSVWGGSASSAIRLPDYVLNGQALVQEGYRFALAHPEILKHMPCICGCVQHGHENNLDCFIQGSGAGGAVIFQPHAAT